ncbi:MAG TPA: uracil-DNA glycosylase family protein [Anaerolineales bacterium]|nr:uracil-DNA glycosylase family protein [Anaerolineales bacterium]
MKACRRCLEAGYAIEPPAVFSGKLGARVMVVGQAPGSKEVAADRPFHAGSGARLFDWLRRAGFDEAAFRRDQYITSVTKCFPGKAATGGGDRAPSKAEQALCRPFLDAQLELIRPEVVILVGRLAIDALHPEAGPFEQIIGTAQEKDGRWYVPLPHPSGASRWHQVEANRRKIDRAIRHLDRLRRRLSL